MAIGQHIDPDFSEETFSAIRELVKTAKDLDLGGYKDKCIKRRIAIRIRATRSDTPEEYYRFIRNNPAELDQLLKVITIHVSQFFRNPSTFAKLKDEIIPYLFALAEQDDPPELHLWSVGCAGGEEPYTLALLLRDAFAEEMERIKVEILATDLDAATLETALAGEYPPERLKELPEPLKQRYFRPDGHQFRLTSEIRAMVRFDRQDILRPELYPRSALILCRNVLIYLEREEQQRVMRGFADSLRPGGILVLGKSETLVGVARSLFTTICPIERIYRKK